MAGLLFDPAIFDPAIFDPGAESTPVATIYDEDADMALNLFKQFDTSAGTGESLSLPSVPVGATGAYLAASGGNITFRADGGNATVAGIPIPDGNGKAVYNALDSIRWCGANGTTLCVQWLRGPVD